MPNYKLTIQYDGSNYAGWQMQKNAISVQQEIINVIKKITQEDVNLIGSGRTDSGVHALGQVANFIIDNEIDQYKFFNSINSLLPSDIAVKEIVKVKDEFHARFDATKRSYIYFFINHKSPFYSKYAAYANYIDNEFIAKANKLSEQLIGEHDFTSFSKLNTETKTNLCKVYESHWRKSGNTTLFYIQANRYLHGMVRTIVGTISNLIQNGSSEDINSILTKKSRQAAGISAPAKGLFLNKIMYK